MNKEILTAPIPIKGAESDSTDTGDATTEPPAEEPAEEPET